MWLENGPWIVAQDEVEHDRVVGCGGRDSGDSSDETEVVGGGGAGTLGSAAVWLAWPGLGP